MCPVCLHSFSGKSMCLEFKIYSREKAARQSRLYCDKKSCSKYSVLELAYLPAGGQASLAIKYCVLDVVLNVGQNFCVVVIMMIMAKTMWVHSCVTLPAVSVTFLHLV